MSPRQFLTNAFGAILALAAGVPYFSWLLGQVWWMRPEASYIVPWLLLAMVAVVVVIAFLTIVLAPTNRWLYPLMFSSATLAFGVGALGEPRAAAFWIALGVATLVLSLGSSYVTHVLRSRKPAP
jgi:hypothetical protein